MTFNDPPSALLEELRPKAFAIAYRMLGSVSDSEDVVQEGLMRLHEAMQRDEAIASPPAYLTTIVTRLCIDHLRSARVQREQYVGEWLPEPLLSSSGDEVGSRPELRESIGMAFLIVLETLSPEQRAVFLLRDVFDYDYAEIARIIGKSEAACRQLAVRARARVYERRPRFEPRPEQQRELAQRFFAAIEQGELDALEELLLEEVSLHGDGGGRVPALAQALQGREAVARRLLNWRRAAEKAGGFSVEPTRVNGQAGALMRNAEGEVIAVWSLQIEEDHIRAIRVVVNPDKLRHVPGAGDFGRWVRRVREYLPEADA
ncbi:MAG TPA: RNA polymerase sigma-70 factor [Longimicrobiaceae bacterium]